MAALSHSDGACLPCFVAGVCLLVSTGQPTTSLESPMSPDAIFFLVSLDCSLIFRQLTSEPSQLLTAHPESLALHLLAVSCFLATRPSVHLGSTPHSSFAFSSAPFQQKPTMASQNLEKGQLPSYYQDIPTDAKDKIDSKTPAALEEGRQLSVPASAPANKMAYYRRTILFLSFTWLVLYGAALAGENRLRWQKGCHKAEVPEQQSEVGTKSSSEPSSFAALLNGASPKSLHDLLHRHFPNQFRDGVWESEHHAVRAVHEADPALASNIVKMAKRQDNNSTTASTTESSSSPSDTTPSTRPTPTGTPSPTPTSTTPSATVISTTSTTSTSKTSTSKTSAPPTGTLSETTEAPSSSVSSGSSGSSSSSPSSTGSSSFGTSAPGSSSSGVSSFSAPSRLVSSVVDGDTTLTTSTVSDPDQPSTTPAPTRTSKSIVTTFTRTSNGNVVTITSTTYVDADPEPTGPADTQTRPTPGLQNSAPKQQRGSVLAGIIALMGVMMV
ncbi:hypothetical protein QBC38DRAFT_469584 [Podospora fimiseda]|uniref:Uncharacterized protein n=1 Tax=Podospora fimiseda TaxID=252190 RepID=A0AAN7BWW1_9PEZI|nr:hypothetical protein QBC38DRAFT_469584 [Podospora fimiseda]